MFVIGVIDYFDLFDIKSIIWYKKYSDIWELIQRIYHGICKELLKWISCLLCSLGVIKKSKSLKSNNSSTSRKRNRWWTRTLPTILCSWHSATLKLSSRSIYIILRSRSSSGCTIRLITLIGKLKYWRNSSGWNCF